MLNIYNTGNHLKNNPFWHAENSRWKGINISKIIQKNKLNTRKICEISYGTRERLCTLDEKLDNTTTFHSFEISDQAYDFCRIKENDNITFFVSNLFERDLNYDIAMAIDVYEHIEDYLKFLRDLKSKASYKISHIPLDLSAQSVLREEPILKKLNTIGHIHYFTKNLALLALEDCGYEVIDYSYTCGSSDSSNRGVKSNLANIPRKLTFIFNQDLCARPWG